MSGSDNPLTSPEPAKRPVSLGPMAPVEDTTWGDPPPGGRIPTVAELFSLWNLQSTHANATLPSLFSGQGLEKSVARPRLIDPRPRARHLEGRIPGSASLVPGEIGRAPLRPPRWRPLWILPTGEGSDDDVAVRMRDLGYDAAVLGGRWRDWRGPWERGPELYPAWEPSFLVSAWGDRLPAGRAVDLACGAGRDAVYLAIRGFEVRAIDWLPDALDQARALADRHEVQIDWVLGDVERDESIWEGEWDLINVQRFLHRPLFRLLDRRLGPQGTLLYETFLERQRETGRKPRRPEHLLKHGELLERTGRLDPILYQEGETHAGDWTARLVGRRR